MSTEGREQGLLKTTDLQVLVWKMHSFVYNKK